MPDRGPPDSTSDAYREALALWLRWNTEYEHLNERMFQSGQDQRLLEELGDRLDELRREATTRSRELLNDHAPPAAS